MAQCPPEYATVLIWLIICRFLNSKFCSHMYFRSSRLNNDLSVSGMLWWRSKQSGLNCPMLSIGDQSTGMLHVLPTISMWKHVIVLGRISRGVISTFSWGAKFFFDFSMPPDYWKIEKKQHFICSNLTSFIVPFFLFFLSFSFFFLFFLSFFFFSFSLGGSTAPMPPQMTLLQILFMLYNAIDMKFYAIYCRFNELL